MIRGVWSIVIVCLLTACSTKHYISIDTYNPAEVTFPDHVTNVLIVNNVVPQPPESGCSYEYLGVLQDSCRAKADTAISLACYSLGKAIVAADYFNDVLFYNEPVRTDNNYLREIQLTHQQVTDLCLANNADAIISFDRLLFSSNRKITSLTPIHYEGEIMVEVRGVLRAYLPGRESPLATVIVEDSVLWREAAADVTLLNLFLPSPDEALATAAVYAGERTSPNFVPYWINDARWYYSGISSSWKKGAAYIKASRWEKALQQWEDNYNNSEKWLDKAKASSNLVLCYELIGKLEDAKKWAELSLQLFTDNFHKEEKEKDLLKRYIEVLNARILADRKLNLQMGV